MTWPGLTQDFERLCSACQVCQMTKKERKNYGMLPPKIAESDPGSLGHGLYGSGGTTPFSLRTPAKTHSLLALTMIDPSIHHWLV
jgi:hypothetical protein